MTHASDNFFPQSTNKEKVDKEFAAKSNSQLQKYPVKEVEYQTSTMTSGSKVVKEQALNVKIPEYSASELM